MFYPIDTAVKRASYFYQHFCNRQSIRRIRLWLAHF